MLRAGVALGVFALAGWMGYAFTPERGAGSGAGSMKVDDDASSGRLSPTVSLSMTGEKTAGAASKESPEVRARRVAELKQKVKDMWRSSPSYGANWDLDRETHRLLATLEPEELDVFYKELPATGGGLPAHVFLRLEVLKAWAVKDGPGAIQGCVNGGSMDTYSRARAIGAWGEADPEGALAWLRREDLPESVAKDRRMLRANLMINLARSNYDRATEELQAVGADERESIIAILIREGTGKGRDVEGLLESSREYAEVGKVSRAEDEFISAFARTEPEAALQKIAALEGIDEAERDRLDLQVLHVQASRRPEAFDEWLARNPGTQVIPDGAWSAFSNSIGNDADAVRSWLDRMPEGGFRDEFHERGVRGFASIQRFDDAVRFSGRISDPVIRADTLRALNTVWKNADAPAAERWRQSLPATDREALGE